jgi:hypothetical protein
MTMHAQPLLSVADVDVAGAFYAALLGGTDDHGGRHGGAVREYARIEIGDRLVLQLHVIGADHHHGALAREGVALGNGVAVWFATGLSAPSRICHERRGGVDAGDKSAAAGRLAPERGPAQPPIGARGLAPQNSWVPSIPTT